MAVTKQQLEDLARAGGKDPANFWPVTPEELSAWGRDFYQELAQPAGRSFCACLDSTISRQPNEYFRNSLTTVNQVVALGVPLSKAMALFPDIFNEIFLVIVRYGEIYGELDLTLQRFAEKPEDMFPRCGVRREE